jgi:arylsulfatase A
MERNMRRLVMVLMFAAMFEQCHAADETKIGEGKGDESRPNVIFILADDLGYGDVKAFGEERCRIETPHFDRLAEEGVRFTDAHAVGSVCIPSRIGIMTGRYPWRFARPRTNGPWGFVNPQLPEGCFTLGTMLQESGYRTGYVGKWHLGTLMTTRDGANQNETNVDYEAPIQIGPPQFGFDDSFILPGSLDMYPYVFVRNNEWVGQVTAQKGWSAFNRVGPAAEDFEDTKVLDTFCDEAERFIAENAAGSREGNPFFLYLALTSPHTPLSVTPEFEGRSPIGLYGDFVMETDACVGRVLAALEEYGLDDDTLVIATSDHGAAPYAGRRREATAGQLIELEDEGHYSRGIYRGYKFSIYEGGLRIPLVARWPGVTPSGATCDDLVGLNDLSATVAEIVGYDLAANESPDSISFLPLLQEPSESSGRDSHITQSTRAMAIRSGDWKLALCPGSGCPGGWGNAPANETAWREVLEAYGKTPASRAELGQAPFVQLFNLDEDPGEAINLAAEHPEKVREMIAQFQSQVDAGRSRPGPEIPNDIPQTNRLWSGVPKFVWE